MAVFGRVFRILLIVGLVLGVLAGTVYAMQLDEQVQAQFKSKRWALPARVFARPLELFQGQQLEANHLEQELKLLSYLPVTDRPVERGQYQRKAESFEIITRGFQFNQDKEDARSIKLSISGGKVSNLALSNGGEVAIMRLEPVLIGNFYPTHNEDRILVQMGDVPTNLLKALLAVEDKKFYEHQGVNPMAIIRAMVANLKAGDKVQGGSTITQQLVKNFYLTNERSWQRKLKEALMAFLLELHFTKQEILEAYLNEIHLGQDGDRAIHGFGLAAQFYFNRELRDLKDDQIALLVGLAKGSSAYNPRRNADKALERRNVVLTVMEQEKILTPQQAESFRALPLGVSPQPPSGASPFPAYLDLVRQQLQRDYREEDLRTEGLLIFTAMDPIVQLMAEQTVIDRVQKLERANRIPRGKLTGAMVISTVQGGEVIALVGGLNVRYPGYNRALTAQRQIGSLVKPAIYLAAIESGGRYSSLGARVSDGPVVVKIGRNKYWEPGNYDQRDMGTVTVMQALALSRNTPAVRIGVDVGLDKVIKMLGDLGINKQIPAFPSILLGALEMTPMNVQQMYQTMAAGGSYSPLKAIRQVMEGRQGRILTRYPLTVKQVAKPESVDVLDYGLHQVTVSGTAKMLSGTLPSWKKVAGKTGTTNDKKDSWFAGFSGEHVMTVWVGRDDNKPINMTGGTGALYVWSDMMRQLNSKPMKVGGSSRLVWVDVDESTGLLFNPACGKAVKMPFIRGTQPKKVSYCAAPVAPTTSPEEAPAQGSPAPAPARPAAQGRAGNWVEDLMR
ncbi:penicillin-binding protein 1B [Thiolinea disciformis]|uniref:penicillin-binding protein 1B n=1 Tax=Thiolinea disciformis TaxID=125614 RepID=UPI000379E330|nr:penicillin-binding protein 1B [Thiolinea disciformis]